MKNIILFIWQLPQNILGLLVILFSKTWTYGFNIYWTEYNFGVSLGKYIILNNKVNSLTINHEKGHQKQSLYLGWLYLLIIGLPSFIGNIWDRLLHKSWSIYKREKWYYSLPWEKSADKLGKVRRWGDL